VHGVYVDQLSTILLVVQESPEATEHLARHEAGHVVAEESLGPRNAWMSEGLSHLAETTRTSMPHSPVDILTPDERELLGDPRTELATLDELFALDGLGLYQQRDGGFPYRAQAAVLVALLAAECPVLFLALQCDVAYGLGARDALEQRLGEDGYRALERRYFRLLRP